MSDSVPSPQREYWLEIIADSFRSHSIAASDEQIAGVADDICISHDNYSLAFYTPPYDADKDELSQLRRELQRERSATFCCACNGTGYITEDYGIRSSTSPCYKCKGKGKLYA